MNPLISTTKNSKNGQFLAVFAVLLRFSSLEEGNVSDSVSETTYTVNGSAVLIDGHEGEKALEINGSDTYINLGTAFQPTNAYTMMDWVKQAPNPTDGQAKAFLVRARYLDGWLCGVSFDISLRTICV